MEEINYRTAEIVDLPILYEFEQGIVTAERPFDPTLKDGHINYYDIKALIESDDAEVLVAVVANEIVGSGYVKIKKADPFLKFETYAHIGFMFVKPEFRGKGISQEIIQNLKTWAKLNNQNELRLRVYEDNYRAVAAYEKVGLKKFLVEMRMKM